jgi:hypothetical protein
LGSQLGSSFPRVLPEKPPAIFRGAHPAILYRRAQVLIYAAVAAPQRHARESARKRASMVTKATIFHIFSTPLRVQRSGIALKLRLEVKFRLNRIIHGFARSFACAKRTVLC